MQSGECEYVLGSGLEQALLAPFALLEPLAPQVLRVVRPGCSIFEHSLDQTRPAGALVRCIAWLLPRPTLVLALALCRSRRTLFHV